MQSVLVEKRRKSHDAMPDRRTDHPASHGTGSAVGVPLYFAAPAQASLPGAAPSHTGASSSKGDEALFRSVRGTATLIERAAPAAAMQLNARTREAGDAQEREADAIADRVMGMSRDDAPVSVVNAATSARPKVPTKRWSTAPEGAYARSTSAMSGAGRRLPGIDAPVLRDTLRP